MKLKITLNVPTETINDIMVTALEGGINYWCNKAEIMTDTLPKRVKAVYASDVIGLGGTLRLYDAESKDTWLLTPKNFAVGLQLYVSKCIADNDKVSLDSGDIDASDADCIIQYAIFGTLIFG